MLHAHCYARKGIMGRKELTDATLPSPNLLFKSLPRTASFLIKNVLLKNGITGVDITLPHVRPRPIVDGQDTVHKAVPGLLSRSLGG
jgi:hypothetical protein